MTHRTFVHVTRIVAWSDGTTDQPIPRAPMSRSVDIEHRSRRIPVQVRGERWVDRVRRVVGRFRSGRGA